MQALADTGGHVLADDDGRLLFLRRRLPPSWLVLVPAVVAVVAGGHGLVQLLVGHVVAGGVLLAAAVAAGLGLRAVLGRRRRARAAALDPATAVLVLDLRQATLLDGVGRVLAPLTAVRVDRAVQATSSARALRVTWPGGSAVAYRGDPLVPDGSIDAAVRALRERGVPVA